ncbi:hypothetical protein BsWGS_15308 [Bradybaena similaris]
MVVEVAKFHMKSKVPKLCAVGKLLSKVPLSNNTISRRIQRMVEDLKDKLIVKTNGKEFGLQLDEAMDSNKAEYLIYYARFTDGNDIVEDLFFCKSNCANTKLQDFVQDPRHIWLKRMWSGQSALVSVLMVVIQCPVIMEGCRHLFKAKLRIHCGPIALFTEKHWHQSILALH